MQVAMTADRACQGAIPLLATISFTILLNLLAFAAVNVVLTGANCPAFAPRKRSTDAPQDAF